MSGRALHAELNAVRALVSDGLAATAAGDVSQFRVRSACARLASVDALLVEAAGVLAAPVRVGLATLVCFPAVALAAAAARAAGQGTAGMLTATGLVLLAVLAATPWADRRVRVAVGRRRLARAGHPAPGRAGAARRGLPAAPILEKPDPATPAEAPARDPAAAIGRVPAPASRSPLAGVPGLLLTARVRLVSATLRQAGSGRWSPPELRHAARTDPAVRRLAEADLQLCQAVDCLERYVDDLAKGWP